jgi:hypothetical protein
MDSRGVQMKDSHASSDHVEMNIMETTCKREVKNMLE